MEKGSEVRPPCELRFSIWGGREVGPITALLPVLWAEMQGIHGTGPQDWTETTGGGGAGHRLLKEQRRVQGALTENREAEVLFLKLGPGTGVQREKNV